ncbi:UNVERIFIED_CONTAM: hypothetical protein Sradi_6423300 [Sesamum radiatum]|uniref:Uncharacterized protein n=1 Tax=Sesamum radiatum TaxID=300843 RepID=A0AAW2K6Q0_SESRA
MKTPQNPKRILVFGVSTCLVLYPFVDDGPSAIDECVNMRVSDHGFSVLRKDIHADTGYVWSSLGFYMFSLHIPLSYGGLSAATKILHQPVLNPQMEAFLILGLQSLELGIVLLLLQYPGKPQYDLQDFFRDDETRKQRSWLLASVLGFGFLLLLIFITSYIADRLMGPKLLSFLMNILDKPNVAVLNISQHEISN